MTSIAVQDRDFTEWHGGARHVLLWAALVDTDEVRAAVGSARAHWAEVLLPRYERQPHITLRYGGPVPEEGTAPVDPVYAPEQVDADLAILRGLGLKPFNVRISGWDSFPMVPYLPAQAPELHRIADALGENRFRQYVPHVTIGYYTVERPLAELAAMGAGWAHPALTLRVDALSLLRYDAADIAGPLTEVDRFPL